MAVQGLQAERGSKEGAEEGARSHQVKAAMWEGSLSAPDGVKVRLRHLVERGEFLHAAHRVLA